MAPHFRSFNARTSREKRGFSLLELLVVVGLLAVIIAFLVPARRSVSPAAVRRMHCFNNLKQIAQALKNYAGANGKLPPAYTIDADGKPLHSWRTLILPYLDQKALYDQVDLSKPWDDPANADVAKKIVSAFRCPESDGGSTQTTYLAIVTPGSCLRPVDPRRFDEISDGESETLLLVEFPAEHAVHWMAPRDADETLFLSIDQKSRLAHQGGMLAAFADGRTDFLPRDLTVPKRQAMVSISGND